MSELPMLSIVMRALEIHLAFSSLVALAAWVVTSSRFGASSAAVKYWIWVATSINFVLPVGVLVDRFRPPEVSWVLPLEDFGNVIARRGALGFALAATWAVGFLALLVRLFLRIRADRTVRAAASSPGPGWEAPGGLRARGVPVRFESGGRAPEG